MSDHDPALLTHAQLTAAPAEARGRLVEAYLLSSIAAFRQNTAPAANASSRLADIGIDSLQIVELKFGLDQLLGHELDIELIVTNPTIGELAAGCVRDAGL
jgi:acyl carrier protein